MALCCYSDDTCSVDKIRRQLKGALWLIDHYSWLVDAYMSDFFVHRLSSRVPRDWWDVLLAMDPPQLAAMLKPETPQTSQVWPLSLLAFHASVHSLSLSNRPLPPSNRPLPPDTALCGQLLHRDKTKTATSTQGDCCHGNGRTQQQVNGEAVVEMTTTEMTRSDGVTQAVVSPLVSALSSVRDGQLLQLDHCYRRHVKPKKQHEIMTLAPLLNDLCKTCHCQRVVDVGAGQGHLSRLLAFGYDLNVTTVEAAGCHAPKAAKFDGEVKDDIRKERFHRNKERHSACEDQESRCPRHLVATIDHEDSVDDFLAKLELRHQDVSCQSSRHQQDVTKQEKQPKPNHNETSDCEARLSQGGQDNKTIQHETKGGEILHKTTEHEITHCEANGFGFNRCESESVDANDSETKPEKTKGPEIDCCETKGHETNHEKTKEDEISRCKTKRINYEIMNGHETNHKTKQLETDTNSGFDMTHHHNSQHNLSDWPQSEGCRSALSSEDVERLGPIDHTPQDKTDHRSHGGRSTQMTFDPAHGADSSSAPGHARKCVEPDNTFVLTGLHVCGDLTPTLTRVFVKCCQAAALAVVSCCYMKLSTLRDQSPGSHVGYPMSSQLANHRLSYEALEGACHFNDAYCRKLTNNSPELVSHGYRAALQEIVLEKCPSMQHGSVRLTMRKAHHMTFRSYAEVGLRRLGLESDVSSDQLERAQMKLTRWREVVAFFTLRLCVLPVVETVVLLDRMLFLAQNGVSSCLLPVFDPALSPRNFVLLATKDRSTRS